MGEVMAAAPETATAMAQAGLPAGADARPPQARRGKPRGGRAGAVRYTAEVARAICRRLESGEGLRSICRDPAMPDRSTVYAWMKELSVFAGCVARARRAAGWVSLGASQPLCRGVEQHQQHRVPWGKQGHTLISNLRRGRRPGGCEMRVCPCRCTLTIGT